MMDLLLALATTAALIVAVVGIIVTGYLIYRTIIDYRKIEEMRESLAGLQTDRNRHEYISDEIANVLYDLFNLTMFLKAYVELTHANIKIDERMFDRANRIMTLLEKHFAELGLFSVDAVRRKSVQQALAAKYGDYQTLEIMKKIMDGSLGREDAYLPTAYQSLRRRLMGGVVIDASRWTGRPSGGAF